MGQGFLAGLHDLIAGGNNRDAGLAENVYSFAPYHRQHGDLRESDPLAGAQNGFAGLGLRSFGREIFAALEGAGNRHAILATLHMLHHDDGVGAIGQRRPGHDFYGPTHFAGEDSPARTSPVTGNSPGISAARTANPSRADRLKGG